MAEISLTKNGSNLAMVCCPIYRKKNKKKKNQIIPFVSNCIHYYDLNSFDCQETLPIPKNMQVSFYFENFQKICLFSFGIL